MSEIDKEIHDPHDELEKDIKEAKRSVERKIKRQEKKLKMWKAQLENAQMWPQYQQHAELAKSSYHLLGKGKSSITLYDWACEEEISIALNSSLNAQEQLKSLFKHVKKLKSGIPNLERILALSENFLSKLSTAIDELNKVTNQKELEEWKTVWEEAEKPKKISKETKKYPYKAFKSESGLDIWVGKNAKDNDKLSFKHTHGSDWWLHVANYSGSHVVIKVKKGNEPDLNALQDAAILALHFSKAKDQGSADVHVTQCKFLRKIKNGPHGMVSLSKHRTLHVKKDLNRLQEILNRAAAE